MKTVSSYNNLNNQNAYRPDARSHHPLYTRWLNMMARCHNPRNTSYKSYGAAGISVCKRWHRFEEFVEDMWPSFAQGLTLDRKDPHGDYNKRNCRWVDRATQNMNKRCNHKVPESVRDVLRSRGISFAEYQRRIEAGIPHKQAIIKKETTRG